jgi:hypothetical protein
MHSSVSDVWLSTAKFDFPRTLVVFGNLAILSWVLLAFFAATFANQLYAWLFLLFAATFVFLILRRQGCSSCYYCKSCTSGFGRLAGWFFGAKQHKDISNKGALFLVGITYFLLVLVPMWILAGSLIQEVTGLKAVVLACLLLFTAYSVFTWVMPRRST